MSDAEVSALLTFNQNRQNSVLLSTEGSIGKFKSDMTDGSSRMASSFGVYPVQYAGSSGTTLTIQNINHPSVRGFSLKQNLTGIIPGVAYQSVIYNYGYALSSIGDQPANILYTPGLTGWTYLFNFDAARSTGIGSLWQSVMDHVIGGSAMYKVRWELKCGRNIVLTGADGWCGSGNGTLLSTITVPNVCASSLLPILTGYVYPYYSSNPWFERTGYYTSENDAGYLLSLNF
ncbi:hypothetical protein AKO1_002281 [Acrasis kona]|uniref:Uncharacterized protein n=1 Tax=Acrasis kona TaxID=1008807 RepID=A0AAW2ZNV2_9EUKA